MYRQIIIMLIAVSSTTTIASAGPPMPVLSNSDPGIQILFSGEPNTIESSLHPINDDTPFDPNGIQLPELDCAADAPRAATGGEGGKLHNDFLFCDNWDFQAREWGQATFLQGAFVIGDSPFSKDGGWECTGNEGAGGINPCTNSTIRAVTTFKNQPAPGPGSLDGAPMDPTKDWAVRFDFKMEFAAGDTFGSDKLFELSSRTSGGGGNTSDLLQLNGAFGKDEGSFFPDGRRDRYYVHHGPWPEGIGGGDLEDQNQVGSLIDIPLDEGTITVHYKAVQQRLDLYFNGDLILADFESLSANYDVDFIQLGGGSISFENALYDNVIIGVLAEEGACGTQGPGTSVPGDFNCDGLVDVADLGIVGANFNTTEVTYVDGDANLDNVVDVADLGIVGANWNAAQAASFSQALSTAGLASLLPEPATVTMLVLGLACLGRRRLKVNRELHC